MGFSLVDEPDEVFPVEADANHDIEVMDAEPPNEGRNVPEGQIMVQPIAEDEVCVNGTVSQGIQFVGHATCWVLILWDFNLRVKAEVFQTFD